MAGEILSGWKDIANYMGKGVRTVQRYERELGLPVRRPNGRAKGSVLITKTELEVWIHTAFDHESSYEKPSVNLEDLKSHALELATMLERLIESMNKLAESQKKIAASRTTVRKTSHRVRDDGFRVEWTNGSSRVA
jgi:hypothetical protein